jgi:hypothetical protein
LDGAVPSSPRTARGSARRPALAVDKLGGKRVREILAGGTKAALQKAIETTSRSRRGRRDDARREAVPLHRDFAAEQLRQLHRLLRAPRRDLPGRHALPRRPRLRLCASTSTTPASTPSWRPMANAYLAYCDCTRPGGEKMTVACAFTAGDSDNLFVGRNGIFYDRKGATGTRRSPRSSSNPISIRQAFWSPYKKVLRGIQEQRRQEAPPRRRAPRPQARRGGAAAGPPPRSRRRAAEARRSSMSARSPPSASPSAASARRLHRASGC